MIKRLKNNYSPPQPRQQEREAKTALAAGQVAQAFAGIVRLAVSFAMPVTYDRFSNVHPQFFKPKELWHGWRTFSAARVARFATNF
ncbi:MAG: hypothetical protein WAO02_15285 [Verrucomicrobiia bacterium]